MEENKFAGKKPNKFENNLILLHKIRKQRRSVNECYKQEILTNFLRL